MWLARNLLLLVGAVIVAPLWGWMLIADLEKSDIAVAVGLYFATGAALGYFLGRAWWLAAVAGWPGLLFSLVSFVLSPYWARYPASSSIRLSQSCQLCLVPTSPTTSAPAGLRRAPDPPNPVAPRIAHAYAHGPSPTQQRSRK